MKTLRILSIFCIISGFTFNNSNAQVIHVRTDGSATLTFPFSWFCFNAALPGEMSIDSRWLYGPNFDKSDSWPVGPPVECADFKVHNEEEYTEKGTDGKEYSVHLQWIERRNVNNNNITYNMSNSSQIRCEGKLIGEVHWGWHITLPANCEPGDFSVVTDHLQINCF